MYPDTVLPIVAHVPHAGIDVPAKVRTQFVVDQSVLWEEILTVTDWYTDELFGMPGVARIQTPTSRVVVDTERYLDDAHEPRASVGQGVIYSHDSRRRAIRRALSPDERRSLLDNYYQPWHLKLALDVDQQLSRWGHCLLLDCHSFPNKAFENQEPYSQAAPDVCLGVHSRNTPQWLIAGCHRLLVEKGYSVSLDFPYEGCLLPERFDGNPLVPAIMLEVNRRLYLEPVDCRDVEWGTCPSKSVIFNRVKSDLWELMLLLASEAQSRYP